MKVEQSASFGAENLCRLGFSKAEKTKALMSIIARAIFIASEHKTAQILEEGRGLKALFQYEEDITCKQLYHISGKLYSYKAAIKIVYAQIWYKPHF